MKTSNPHFLALLTAFVFPIVFIICFFGLHFFITNWPDFIKFLISLVIGFVASYIVLRYTFVNFLYQKIKLIYKNINTLKAASGADWKTIKYKSDLIDQANHDVTQWANEKSEEIEKLKELAAFRREFIGNVSHELKTPIFNIQGYISTLLDGALEDPKINRDYLIRTDKSVDRMISIIEDLEAIARLESGMIILNFDKFDIVNLTHEIIESLEQKAKKTDIKISISDNSLKSAMVFADRERISQVISNLIDNSIKYNKEHGSTKISFFDMDEKILIEVSDTGYGIEQKDIPRVFERFYRIDKSRSREMGGSGLGLSIVKHIIEAHKQTINIRSKIGVGSTFMFTLDKWNNKKERE